MSNENCVEFKSWSRAGAELSKMRTWLWMLGGSLLWSRRKGGFQVGGRFQTLSPPNGRDRGRGCDLGSLYWGQPLFSTRVFKVCHFSLVGIVVFLYTKKRERWQGRSIWNQLSIWPYPWNITNICVLQGVPKKSTFWIAVFQNWVWGYMALHCQESSQLAVEGHLPSNPVSQTAIQKVRFLGPPVLCNL